MIKLEIIIAPGFVATELAAVVDVARIANRVSGREIFTVRVASSTPDCTPASLGGLAVCAARLYADDPLPDVLVVVGGSGACSPSSTLLARSQKVARAGGRVVLLSDATTALMRGYSSGPVVVHWENDAIHAELGRQDVTATQLFFRAGGLTTCAGMASTYDAILAIVAELESAMLADDVARVLLFDRRRSGSDKQPQGQSDSPGLPNGPLRHALQLMESSMENPMSTAEICAAVGLSSRQLERIFARSLGIAPQKYHRRLRLRRARLLIESSHLPLTEISLACGFESSSHFSRQFKREYGASPYMLRRVMVDWKAARFADARDYFSASKISDRKETPDMKAGAASATGPRIDSTKVFNQISAIQECNTA